MVAIKRHFAGQGPSDMSVPPSFLLGFANHRLPRAHDLLFVFKGRTGMLLAEEVKVAFADGLVRAAQAEIRGQARAATNKARFAVLEIDCVR